MGAVWAGHEIPRQQWEAMQRAKRRLSADSVPDALVASIAYCESDFTNEQSKLSTPGYNAPNGKEASYSPWQLMNLGGLGDGWTAEQLADLDIAAGIVYQHIAEALERGASVESAVWAWSTRDAVIALYRANPNVEVTPYLDSDPAYEVIGAIRKVWEPMREILGEPSSGERYIGDGVSVQGFKSGAAIIWSSVDGRLDMTNVRPPVG